MDMTEMQVASWRGRRERKAGRRQDEGEGMVGEEGRRSFVRSFGRSVVEAYL